MTYESNYLSHYGVLGMRWGVRKSDNNSTYQESLGRYSKHNKGISDVYSGNAKVMSKTSDYAKTREKRKLSKRTAKDSKKATKMSDAELQRRINRLQKENEYGRLLAQREQAGKILVSDVLDSGAAFLSAAGSVAALVASIYAIKQASNKFDSGLEKK